ncbi:MAG: thioesterase family protein [Anaerolineaceae bacterium]|nr:thioesterase family protein [Anaerolineaceae bacterium]
MAIEPGLIHEFSMIVEAEHTAAAIEKDSEIGQLVPVLSTPYLVSLMETAAHGAVLPFLEPGQSGVGAMIHIKHMAATPVGMQVRIRAELMEVQGRRLLFKVDAWDEVEKIAEGEHERFIINWERFMTGVEKKQAKRTG